MSWQKSLLSLLVKIYPLINWAIPTAGDNYEYDYKVLPPLAMTSVPPIKFLLVSTALPKLPKDELPSQKWLSLLISIITVLIHTNTNSASPASKEAATGVSAASLKPKIKPLDLVLLHQQIKAAKEPESLKEAVLKLASAIENNENDVQDDNLSRRKNDILVEANSEDQNTSEAQFNEIDQELTQLLNKTPLELGSELKTYEASTTLALKKIVRHNVKLLKRELADNKKKATNINETAKSSQNTLEAKPQASHTLDDYEKLFQQFGINRPETYRNFQEDRVFAYMQVAGSNPLMLNQIKTIDSRLPITSEQYQKIVPEDSLEAALQEGRLYLADYSKLGSLANGNIGEVQKYIYAPVALFAVPPAQQQDKNLQPIAIRCQQMIEDKNPIFTPLDGDNWMCAKTIVQMADSNYHELISHLGQTHLFIEPFVLATNRCFIGQDINHPLRVLLKPHFEGTVLINYGAHQYLLAKGGSVDSLLGSTIENDSTVAIKEAQSYLANFNQVALPKTLEKRGVSNTQQLPIYPYRDDGLKIWNAINQWVSDYLGLFYTNDEQILRDEALQKWALELFIKGKCNIGEEGDGHIKTLSYLVEAISTIIFTASAQHAAVNFAQSALMTYAPAFPLACYSSAPASLEKQQNFMGLLPPLNLAEQQISVLYLLGSLYYTELGNYSGSAFEDESVKAVLSKFQVKLKEIDAIIANEDQHRLVSYQFLRPTKIPQSINI